MVVVLKSLMTGTRLLLVVVVVVVMGVMMIRDTLALLLSSLEAKWRWFLLFLLPLFLLLFPLLF